MSKTIVILGLGNILLKDEGVGVHVIKELEKLKLPKNVRLIDGGTAGLDVLSFLQNVEKLIIVDALKAGRKPASIYRLLPDDLENSEQPQALSLHQMGILQTLKVAKKTLGLPPEVTIFGVEPQEIGWGLGLSPEIKEKLPHIVQIILKEANLVKVRG